MLDNRENKVYHINTTKKNKSVLTCDFSMKQVNTISPTVGKVCIAA